MENIQPCKQRRRSAPEIRELIARYRQSQLTQADFVQGEGICLATLSRYLRREKSKCLATGSRGFIEIAPVNTFGPSVRPEPFRVCLREGVTVEIYPGFCGGEVARLLSLIAGMGAQ